MSVSSAFYALSDAFGLALLHSLWQFSLLVLVAVGTRKLLAPWLCAKSAYLLYAGILVLATGLFCYTFVALYEPPVYAASATITNLVHCAEVGSAATILPQDASSSSFLSLESATGLLRKNTALISLCWLLGCLFYSLAYARAIRQLRQLRGSASSSLPGDWQLRFEDLLRTTRISRRVSLAVSPLVDGPLTLGHFKPIILLPAGLLLQLPTAQLEAILLHELGHIQRYDYLVNLVQNGLKTLFFYHPAVHLLCRKIDEERENACDDFAVSHNHNPVVLVRALSALTLHRQALSPTLALQFTHPDYPIVNRLHRLLNSNQIPANMNTSRFFFPFGLLLCFGLFVAAAKGPFIPEPVLPDCEPAAAEVTAIEYLPAAPLAFIPLVIEPAFNLPEVRSFVRDTTPPAQEISLLEAQVARLKAAEERLIARERKLAVTQAYLEVEAKKMEDRSRQLQAEQKELQREAKRYETEASNRSRSTTTTTKTTDGHHTDVTTGLTESDLSAYGYNYGQVADKSNKTSCDSKETSLSLSTEKIICLRDKLTTMLVEDGLLSNRKASVELVLNPENTLVNGAQLPGRLHKKYNKLFNDHCIEAKENRVIQINGKNISVGDLMSSRGVDDPYLVGTSYSESE